MPSKIKWLNIYRRFSKDILLQNSVSQPGFNFRSNMKCQSLKKRFSCLQWVLCLPKGKTEQCDSSSRGFQPLLLLSSQRIPLVPTDRILLMQLCPAQVLDVQSDVAVRSHRHIRATTPGLCKGFSLKREEFLQSGSQTFSFALHSIKQTQCLQRLSMRLLSESPF